MTATSYIGKDAASHIPYCADQGMPNLVGTANRGVSIQYLSGIAMPVGGVIEFEANGLSKMVPGYAVFIHNHTAPAAPGEVAAADRLANQITIGGAAIPTAADLLDIVLVGRLSGQLGE